MTPKDFQDLIEDAGFIAYGYKGNHYSKGTLVFTVNTGKEVQAIVQIMQIAFQKYMPMETIDELSAYLGSAKVVNKGYESDVFFPSIFYSNNQN